ncbi:hypothetical protein ACJ73_00196 [Blastomyces percursus]|uniref:Uncharacterized protein n=1 Tax=Blastomyces percursus TaxID=1658174 RepID=A0A1J9R7L5_9EURO|nr:hypothetical protein ACJ73_00196 [Blastomyces percursus]
MDQKRVVLDAYVNLGRNIKKHPRSSNHVTAFTVTRDIERISVYLENVDGIPYPSIFDEVKAIPAIFATSKVQYMSEITKTLGNEASSRLRNTHWTYTFKLDAKLVGFVADTFLAAAQLVRDIRGIIADCRFQTSDEVDDETIYRAFLDMLQAIKEAEKEPGSHVDYLFMNYASQFQDVISSYGAENVERLRVASYDDDPEAFLERLQPGYFKLNGSAPAPMRDDGLN